MRSFPARVTILLLAAILAASPVLAASPRGILEMPGLFESLRQFVRWIVPSLDKGGITIDPNGAPAPNEGRSTIDPNGAPAEGCGTIDPDGLTLPDNEGRGTIDPNG